MDLCLLNFLNLLTIQVDVNMISNATFQVDVAKQLKLDKIQSISVLHGQHANQKLRTVRLLQSLMIFQQILELFLGGRSIVIQYKLKEQCIFLLKHPQQQL